MGKVIFTPTQKLVIKQFSKFSPLLRQFYFTGGTALSVFYLNHRYSEDLDFFTEEKIDDLLLNEFMGNISSALKTKYRFTKIEEVRIFNFEKNGKLVLKVDFARYPYPRLKAGKIYQGISIDSLLDIAANKLITISQRVEVKDYIDLYFLLQKFTIWDLIYAAEKKFRRETDILLLGTDFLEVKKFDYLPRMVVPLKLADLQEFFIKKAKQLGRRAVKK